MLQTGPGASIAFSGYALVYAAWGGYPVTMPVPGKSLETAALFLVSTPQTYLLEMHVPRAPISQGLAQPLTMNLHVVVETTDHHRLVDQVFTDARPAIESLAEHLDYYRFPEFDGGEIVLRDRGQYIIRVSSSADSPTLQQRGAELLLLPRDQSGTVPWWLVYDLAFVLLPVGVVGTLFQCRSRIQQLSEERSDQS